MWHRHRDPSPVLVEVVPPRRLEDSIAAAQGLLAALAGRQAFALEFAASDTGLRFYARATAAGGLDALLAQLRSAYPLADLRPVPVTGRPDLDPAVLSASEACAALELRLQRDAALPLASDWRRRADPLLGVLAAASPLQEGERVVCQVLTAAAPAGWAERVRVLLDRAERRVDRRPPIPSPMAEAIPLVALLALTALGLQGYTWYRAGELLPLAGTGAAGLVGLPLVAALAARVLGGREPPVRELLTEKLAQPAFATRLRVVAFGPPGASPTRLRSLVERVADAYRAFDHPAGNALRARPWRGDGSRAVTSPRWRRSCNILNAAELAGLWHLPDGEAGLADVERVAVRRLLPASDDLARGCRVGVSRHQGRSVPVAMPWSLLARNQLIVAKTRRGKSTLLLHLASGLMQRMASGRATSSLVVVDPHQDLAEAVLGAVPPALEERVVYLDLADTRRPIGLNLLDVTLFPDRDRTAENLVTMLHRLWPDNWGPRMEGALRAAVASLHQANAVRPRSEQYTLLDVAPLLASADFRDQVLTQVPDRALRAWWRDNYDRLNRVLQQQTANPVTTKIGRFIVTEAARLVLGQASSTLDPRALLHEGGVLVVNSAVGTLGEGAAALMGATLLNLIGLVVEEQVRLPSAQRRRLVALVDESSTLGAADYRRMLSELGKYGASFVLVTQSLAKLDAIDRALRPTLFANIDGLTVFQVSAEDARTLVPELGGDLEVEDLSGLDDFDCYARWSADGRRLPAFSFRVDPPPAMDRIRMRAIADRSAERLGRPRDEVAAAIGRTLAGRGSAAGPPVPPPEVGTDTGEPVGAVQPTARANARPAARSEHRDRRRGR